MCRRKFWKACLCVRVKCGLNPQNKGSFGCSLHYPVLVAKIATHVQIKQVDGFSC